MLLFGDPRPDGHIAFYAYRPTQANAPRRNPELSGPSFKLPDNYKHDLKKQLQRLIRGLEDRRIGSVSPRAKDAGRMREVTTPGARQKSVGRTRRATAGTVCRVQIGASTHRYCSAQRSTSDSAPSRLRPRM